MSWQYSDALSHIAPETGPNLLTGPGPWTVTLEPGQEYVLTVDVLGTSDTLVEWQVSVTDSDGEVLEYPAEGETVPGGEWVTVTRPLTAPAFEASASVTLTAAAETRDPSLAALTGRVVLTVPGDVLADSIHVTEELSGKVAQFMSVSAKEAVITGGLTANAATLIGDTVVDDINVQGKLVGTDGVFKGTVDFENVNVTGEVLAETIMASGGIVAGAPGGARVELTDEGLAAFDTDGTETAQIRGAGGEFVGGVFRTSDNLPGQVTLADDAYINSDTGVAHPGIRVEPLDTSDMVRPPGIGPGDLGLYVDGGSDTSGRHSYLRASPGGSLMRSFREDGTTGGETFASPAGSLMRTYRADGTIGGEIQTSLAASLMRTYREDGTAGGAIQTSPTSSLMRTYSGNASEQGWVRVRPQDAELAYLDANYTYFSHIKADASEAFLYTRAGGTHRYLTVDADGIWAKTHKGGSWEHYNLEETAQDSGWIPLTPATGYQNASGGAPFEYRRMGRMIHLRGRVSATSGVLTAGTAYTIGTLPTAVRPAHTHRTIIAGGSTSAWGRIDISGGTGALTVAPISANMDWVDLAGTMWTVD